MKNLNLSQTRLAGFFLIFLWVVLFPPDLQARDVTFTWTANNETVDGYRLYYKSGTTGGTPYNGTGAAEGSSPLNTGNVTTFTLHGLSDSETYFFALTAVKETLESDYSAELTLEPLPSQPPPGITANFSWLPNQETNLAGYKIHHGTVSATYNTTIDVGNPTPVNGRIQGQVEGLVEGTTYYFAATAYDTSGLESGYSTEMVWTASSQTQPASPPVADNKTLTTSEDQAVSGIVTANNDTGLSISYLVQQNVSHGTLLLETGTGHFTYTPQANFSGTDAFTFLAHDANGDSNLATVNFTVTSVNDAPVAQNANLSTNEDSAISGQLQAQDADSASLAYSTVTNPSHGTVNVTSSGAYTYTPDTNFSGVDTFTFQVNDGQVDSNIATATITINSVNDTPIAQSASITTIEDTAVNRQLQAQDADGDPLTYSRVTSPAHGTVSVSSTGSFTYTPDTGFSGADTFTFRVSDGQIYSNTATISINISSVNDAPVAQNVNINTNEDSAVNGQLQAQDPDGSPLSFSVVTNPGNGTLATNGSGSFTYTPNTDFNGYDSFTFRADDGQISSNTATVNITIHPMNDSPVAVNGTLSAGIGQTSSGTMQASDADNEPLTYSLASDPQQVVTITDATTGAYSVTPVDGMGSPYSFTFVVNDGMVNSNTATITVTLTETDTITEIFGDTPDSSHPGTLKDTFININDNINASTEHISTWSWASPTPHKPANTIIIKTDLTALKKNLKIAEATLYLYQTNATGESTYSNSIHKIIGKNPIIDQVTGNNAYNGEPWTPVETGLTSGNVPLGLADVGPAEDAITVNTQQGYKSWTITEMVQEWISKPADNFGLLISGVPTTAETGRTFAATDNQNNSLRPKLVIRYFKKPPRPSIISVKKVK